MEEIKLISLKEFFNNFIINQNDSFKEQNSPLQTYTLSFLTEHLKTPTTPFKPEFNFIFHLTEGEFNYQVNNQFFKVNAPAVLFISYGNVVKLDSINTPLKGYFTIIENSVMTSVFKSKDSLNLFTISPLLNLNQIENDWILQLNKLLYEELNDSCPNREIAESLLQTIIQKILKLSNINPHLTRNEIIAIEFKKLVFEHFKEHKMPQFYAEQLAISINYLNRCVNKVFKKSCSQVILEIVVLQSQILLWDNSKTISEISYDLNFEYPSYFSKVFKKYAGITPSDYRSKILDNAGPKL